jgi:uncharacterized protein (TIGR03067 family)
MNWSPVLALAFAVGAPVPKEAPKKAEPPAIVGEWFCTKIAAGGKEFPEEGIASIRLTFTADGKLSFKFGDEIGDCTYTTDTSKDPAHVDYSSAKTAKGNKGIFKVDKDTLTFCFTEGGGERPTKFESPAGSRILLLTLARKKADKD